MGSVRRRAEAEAKQFDINLKGQAIDCSHQLEELRDGRYRNTERLVSDRTETSLSKVYLSSSASEACN